MKTTTTKPPYCTECGALTELDNRASRYSEITGEVIPSTLYSCPKSKWFWNAYHSWLVSGIKNEKTKQS